MAEGTGEYTAQQDLHIHTTFSRDDGSVIPEQTVELISKLRYARIMGISDHCEFLTDGVFPSYEKELRRHGFYVGVEVNGMDWVDAALEMNVDYYIYHCRDRSGEYGGAEALLTAGKPVIIAHPLAMGTDLEKVPDDCLIEINNRYIMLQDNWGRTLTKYRGRFQFVLGSDAHQPHWLNQTAARYVARQISVEETLLFPINNIIISGR